MNELHNSHRGFAAIAAIFLVVVLAALGGYLLSSSNTQQLTSVQDVQGTRAYWAARAGLEWGVGSVVANAACPVSPKNLVIEGFNVVIFCTSALYVDGGSKTIYQLKANASAGGVAGAVGFIERSVSAGLEL
ncbi:hypothetical protein [Rhodoferax saidenbachensis]|uniref:MSHA biogenesis protein MshP n=1 Tax=Rhodoferax saidenbachensis TaxID=1484693 RepID=A0ABU1ZN49_9BURK|nr:hypothetical protein [Rhodoferax saidenbachensis]MDR7306967.1 MSHA biogenesis protein MshP [Rhodoferax saidenbachensis]